MHKEEVGVVMLKTKPVDVNFDGINIYNAKNPKHFWLGISRPQHFTLHYGFYLSESKADFIANVKMHELPHLFDGSEINTTPSFFAKNPKFEDEDNYFTVVLKLTPPEIVDKFRSILLNHLPHYTFFPKWSPHVTIATVSTEKDRDKLMKRLKGVKVSLTELFISFV